MKPRISIITPTLNSQKTLPSTIDSLNNQKFKNFEHIVIDGSSNDDSCNIAKQKSKNLTYIYSGKDNGLYYAINHGIEQASGEIIGILNSDDQYHSNEVLSQVNDIFEDESIALCFANIFYDYNKKRIFKRFWNGKKFQNASDFLNGNSPPHPTVFVRREIYEHFGKFDTKYRISADFEILLRFLFVNKIKFLYKNETWVKMKHGGISGRGGISLIKQNLEVIDAFNKNQIKINIFIFFLRKTFVRLTQFRLSFTDFF